MNKRTERMNSAIGAYFAACDATRERRELKNGSTEERQIPYTLFGLARAVRLTPEEILAAFHAEKRSDESRILRDAVLRIAAYTLERTLLGELSGGGHLASPLELFLGADHARLELRGEVGSVKGASHNYRRIGVAGVEFAEPAAPPLPAPAQSVTCNTPETAPETAAAFDSFMRSRRPEFEEEE